MTRRIKPRNAKVEIKVKHNRKTYDFLQKTKKRINILYGSAGSGKSWGIAQFLLLEKLYTEKNIRILITRKTRPALKKSAYLLINDLISKYDLPGAKINKSDLIISVGNNQMFFVPLDDPEKLKSFEKINYVWSEESTEITREDYLQLRIRCRGANPNGANQLFFSFNPVDEQSFWKELTDSPSKDTAINHSTYKDNAFLDQDYIDELEGLKNQDVTYHKIYALGIWASPEHIIYTNWDTVPAFPDSIDEYGYGLDFGYNNPTALARIGLKDMEIYLDELIYESKLTNNDLIEKMKTIISNKAQEIKADSAEPQRIEEISRAGFNIHPCTKGPDSIKVGIDRCKRLVIHITERSVNLIKEIKGYKWKTDKNGNVLDKPVKFRDHLMDAIRYYLGEMPAISAPTWVDAV